MEFDLTVFPSDGVGPAVTSQAVNVLRAVGERFGHSLNLNDGLVGGVAIDVLSEAPSYETLGVIVKYAKGEYRRRVTLNKSGPNWRGE